MVTSSINLLRLDTKRTMEFRTTASLLNLGPPWTFLLFHARLFTFLTSSFSPSADLVTIFLFHETFFEKTTNLQLQKCKTKTVLFS